MQQQIYNRMAENEKNQGYAISDKGKVQTRLKFVGQTFKRAGQKQKGQISMKQHCREQ